MMPEIEAARVVDELLAYVPAPEHRADARRAAVPLPGQRHLIARAIEDARRAGLRLPDRFLVKCVEGEGGLARMHEDGRYSVTLGVDASPDRLRETTFHEMQHLSDFLDGTYARVSRVEFERRAIDFAARMMRHV
jgi:hypothetical protein